MKKTLTILLTLLLTLTCLFGSAISVHAANVSFHVQVYATDGEGLALKAAPDIDAQRFYLVPEGTNLTIDQTSEGWGHTYYNGQGGWVYLQYTKLTDRVISQYPAYGFTKMSYYMVHDTEGEGLELRTQPTNKSSTFGAMRDGTVVTVQAIQGEWAYTYYSGNFGWAHMNYLTPFTGSVSYRVTVYDTDGEGLSLKTRPDVNSERYVLIPENTQLAIDSVTDNGWGRTTYNGYTGWVSLRYTRIVGDYCSDIPTNGFMNAVYYTVYNTEGEGLELRTRPTVEASTYGPIYDGTSVLVQAIEGDWAYFYYNGHFGWSNLTYLR